MNKFPAYSTTAATSFFRPSLIGNHYRLGDTILGFGSFSTVFAAVDIRTNPPREVAIKVIERSKLVTAGEWVLEDINTEVSLLQGLHHPHIIQLLEFLSDDSCYYLVFERAETDLFTVLELEGRLEEERAKEIFRQLLSAVAYLHANYVTHRDIKIENVLLDHKGNVKLSDFGFATRFAEDQKLQRWCGSPMTVAPEIIKRIPYDGRSVDAFSCGAVFYTMLTGASPFEAAELRETLKKIAFGQYVLPPTLSAEARDLIQRLLQGDPQLRISTKEALEHPFLQPKSDSASQIRETLLREEGEQVNEKHFVESRPDAPLCSPLSESVKNSPVSQQDKHVKKSSLREFLRNCVASVAGKAVQA